MIALIAAVSLNGVIGKDGKIPWHLPQEQQRFKRLTMGQSVIMGRRSFEEVGHALLHRQNIVLTRNPDLHWENVETAGSLEEALALRRGLDCYIAIGQQVFEEALPLADFLVLSRVLMTVSGDPFFPSLAGRPFVRAKAPLLAPSGLWQEEIWVRQRCLFSLEKKAATVRSLSYRLSKRDVSNHDRRKRSWRFCL